MARPRLLDPRRDKTDVSRQNSAYNEAWQPEMDVSKQQDSKLLILLYKHTTCGNVKLKVRIKQYQMRPTGTQNSAEVKV